MRQNEHGQYVSDDGFWVWDGVQWVAAASAAPASTGDADDTDDVAAAPGQADEALLPRQAEASQPGSPAPVVPRVDRAHPLSPDGRSWWTGDEWVPVPAAGAGAADPERADPEKSGSVSAEPLVAPAAAIAPFVPTAVAEAATAAQAPAVAERRLSPDGYWAWDGTAWVPAGGQVSTFTGRPLSPDGRWEWDGAEWVAVVPSAAPSAVAQLSADGQWQWTGADWIPAAR